MKKVIQSRAFRESRPDTGPEAVPTGTMNVHAGLQAAFAAWLEREAESAAIINAMTFRVDPRSELALKARNYAARLRLYVIRICALLPDHMRIHCGPLLVASNGNPALTPGTCNKAAFVLVEYLLHHAEDSIEFTLSLRETPANMAGEKLIRRMIDERRILAHWIKTSGKHRQSRTLSRERTERIGLGDLDAEDERPGTQQQIASPSISDTAALPDPFRNAPSRFAYRPSQTVRWM